MKSWRLNWAVAEIGNPKNFSAQRRLLRHPWKFWLALLLKFIPHLWPWPFALRLRDGGAFVVHRFMTLFIYTEIFVDRCYDLSLDIPGDAVILDVGANTGLFILRMKQIYPDSTIFGFEPEPGNFRELNVNLDLSQLSNVKVFDCGVGARSRPATLHLHPHNIGGNSLYASQAPGGREVGVKLIDVEEMLGKTPRDRCDLLKLDCEGAELEIIKAISSEVAPRIRTIVVELTPSLYDISDVTGHLESVGYRVARNSHGIYVASQP